MITLTYIDTKRKTEFNALYNREHIQFILRPKLSDKIRISVYTAVFLGTTLGGSDE